MKSERNFLVSILIILCLLSALSRGSRMSTLARIRMMQPSGSASTPDINAESSSVNIGAGNPNSGASSIGVSAGNGAATSTGSTSVSTTPGGTGSGNTVVVSGSTPSGNFSGSSTTTSSTINGNGASGYSYSSSSSSSVATGGSSASTTSSGSSSTSNGDPSRSTTPPATTTTPPATTVTPIVTPITKSNISFPLTISNYIVKNSNLSWKALSSNAPIDQLSLSAEGDLYIISDNILYYYDYSNNKFILADGLSNSGSILLSKKVSVAPDGTPFIIDYNNALLYFNQISKQWIKIVSCGQNLTIGKNGQIFYIECQNNNVMQISCTQNNGLTMTKNLQFLISSQQALATTPSGLPSSCTAQNLGGYATKVEVLPDGAPIIISTNSQLMYYKNSEWAPVYSMYGNDISVSNDGLLFIVATDSTIFAINYFADPTVIYTMPSKATAISAGPNSQPVIINKQDSNLYTSINFYFSP